MLYVGDRLLFGTQTLTPPITDVDFKANHHSSAVGASDDRMGTGLHKWIVFLDGVMLLCKVPDPITFVISVM